MKKILYKTVLVALDVFIASYSSDDAAETGKLGLKFDNSCNNDLILDYGAKLCLKSQSRFQKCSG
ncbi:hypothetical protein FLACHUCJ7_02222 [Flavobacterium chungangense]|uniref:Uncharacterized protein n=1 Tax=Flavobacterium chungangense TaxID=554283 RepID=A0A6V6Z0B4_9FLAO|nr:hypothetical protein FLACHUCJ7_02222 [Flavobacterium chungangense]